MKFKLIKSNIISDEYAEPIFTEEEIYSKLPHLSEELQIDIDKCREVIDLILESSKKSSDYINLYRHEIASISNITGISEEDIETIALEIGYMVSSI